MPELLVTRQSLQFQHHTDSTIDYVALTETLAENKLPQLDEALKNYRGDLLGNLYLEDAPRFNEWLTVTREQLRQRVLDAYRRLCETYETEQKWEQGQDAVRRWLAIDDLDEEAHRWMMQFLTNNGKLDLALRHYQRCKQKLMVELGVEPSPATAGLALQIEAMQARFDEYQWNLISPHSDDPPTLELPKTGELMAPGPLPANAYLPHRRNDDFTGRENELIGLANELLPRSDLSADLTRTVAITGMGGLGKTQLAVEFAYRFGRFYPGGVFWLSFSQPENIAEEISRIGGERGMELYQEADKLSRSEQTGRVQRAWQEATSRLLIFDNCDDEALLSQWQPVSGGCKVLVTSRRASWSRELNVKTLPLGVLERQSSLALLQQFIPKIDPQTGSAIADEVGDLPLALHLAGGFLRRYSQVSPEKYLTQLRDKELLQHPSLLGRGTQYSPTGHELSVARTFDITISQLHLKDEIDCTAKAILNWAACFAPNEPIPKKILTTMVMNINQGNIMAELLAEDGLTRLVDLGLLDIKEEETVAIHRLVARFTQVAFAKETTQAKVAVALTLVKYLSDHLARDTSLYAPPILASHIRFITDAAIERQDLLAVQLGNLLGGHLRDIAAFDDAKEYTQHAIQISQDKLGETHPDTAQSFYSLGLLFWHMGTFEKARTYLEKALAIQEEILGPDNPETAKTMNSLGAVLQNMGEFDLALPHFERTLAISEHNLGANHPRLAITHNNLGLLLERTGQYQDARRHMELAISIWEKTIGRSHPYIAHGFNNLGVLLGKMGDHEKARQYLVQAMFVRILKLGAEHPDTARTLNSLGSLLTEMGDYESAQALLERALIIREGRLGAEHPVTALSLNNLGRLYLEQGLASLAQPYVERALAIRQKVLPQNHPDIGASLMSLGELHQIQRHPEQARKFYKTAIATLKKTVDKDHPTIRRAQSMLASVT